MKKMTKEEISSQKACGNPFFNPYRTPHNAVPFTSIHLKDFKPAILRGIEEEDKEIEAITSNPDTPTYDNTIRALEESGKLLEKSTTVLGNLLSSRTSDALEKIAHDLMPHISKHSNDISFNSRLFERIKAVRDSHPKLAEEEQTLLDKLYENFVRRGVGLSEEKKDKLRELSLKLSQCSMRFSQNILKDTNSFTLHITEREDLKGLPDLQIELAALAAKEKGVDGWVFSLQAPSYSPFMTYSDRRELRKKLYMAYNTLCTHPDKQNNFKLVKEIVNLRLAFAQTLGYKSFADFALKERMAENVATVEKFLNRLLRAYKPVAVKDMEALTDFARQTEGDSFQLMPWDFGYYSHKLKLKKFDIDAEMLRPYFELSKVKEGVFGLANTLYGITFRRNRKIPVYHRDVEAYEVFDSDGSFLALLYADFFPRKSKKSGAWMTSFQEQCVTKDGENQRPHASIVMNLTKPTADKPSLLTLGEVSTFLHEFGHALHEIFSQCHSLTLSGTNVYWDFVELPSQFMENYATEKEFLRTFAFHYQTGEPLPDELIQRVKDSKTFNAAYAGLRQISLGLLDMAYYTREEPLDEDIISFEKRAWRRAVLFPQNLPTCMTTQFQHIISGGYAAGYYCYKWAEVLDADAFSLFKETGIFNKKTAGSFRRHILEKGGTKHPKVLYKAFRKRQPTIQALLQRDGIITTK